MVAEAHTGKTTARKEAKDLRQNIAAVEDVLVFFRKLVMRMIAWLSIAVPMSRLLHETSNMFDTGIA